MASPEVTQAASSSLESVNPALAVPVASAAPRVRAPSQFHIPSLDGFRAFAILLVFLSHAGLGHLVPGGLGVTIFFFLSGYLITTLLRREYERKDSIDLRHFYFRRILRIWPAFYLVLLTGIALTLAGVLPGQNKGPAVLAQVFHVANYYSIFVGTEGMTAGTGVYWSLAVEEHFYLLFPFFYLVMRRWRVSRIGQVALIAVICLAVLAWRVYLIGFSGATNYRTYYASDTRIDSLLFGCALAVWGNPVFDRLPTRESTLKFVLVPLGLALLLVSLLFRSEVFRETLRYTLQGLALIPIFAAAVAFPEWRPFRLLNHRWIAFLGTLSYSFYLLHYTVIEAIKWYAPDWPRWTQGVISMIVSVSLSYAVYKLVEQPLTALRRRLGVG